MLSDGYMVLEQQQGEVSAESEPAKTEKSEGEIDTETIRQNKETHQSDSETEAPTNYTVAYPYLFVTNCTNPQYYNFSSGDAQDIFSTIVAQNSSMQSAYSSLLSLITVSEQAQPIFDKYTIFGSIPGNVIRDPFYNGLITVCYSVSIITVLSWLLMLLMILSTTKFKKFLVFLTLLYAIDISIILTKTTVMLNEQFLLNYQDSSNFVKVIIYDNLVFALNLIVRIFVVVNWYLLLTELFIFNKNSNESNTNSKHGNNIFNNSNNNNNYIHQYITEEGSQDEDMGFNENENNHGFSRTRCKKKWYTYILKYEVCLGLIIWHFIVHILQYFKVQGKFDIEENSVQIKLLNSFSIINNLIIFISFLIFINYYYYFKIIKKRKYLFPGPKKKNVRFRFMKTKKGKEENSFNFLNNSDNESLIEETQRNNDGFSGTRDYRLQHNIYSLLILISVLNFSPLIFYILSLSVFKNWSIFFIDFLSIFVTILNWELYQRISELKFFLELKNSIGRKVQNDNDLAVVVNYKFNNYSKIDDPRILALKLKQYLNRSRRRTATETTATEVNEMDINGAQNGTTTGISNVDGSDLMAEGLFPRNRRSTQCRNSHHLQNVAQNNIKDDNNKEDIRETIESTSYPPVADSTTNIRKFIRTIFSPISDNIQLHKITEIRLNTPVNNKSSNINQTGSTGRMAETDDLEVDIEDENLSNSLV